MTLEWFVCKGGPFNNQLFRAGDDVPEGWRITLSTPTGLTEYDHAAQSYQKVIRKGTYTRKGDVLVWKEGIE